MTPVEVVITAGDPQGIGPEVAARAATVVARRNSTCGFVIVGDPDQLAPWLEDGVREASDVITPGVTVLPVPSGPLDDPPPSVSGGRAALAALEVGFERVAAAASRRALVTAPVSKEAITAAGCAFTGHTGWLAQRCGVDDVVMLFVADRLRVALATVHVPLRDVPSLLTRQRLDRTLAVVEDGLRERYGIGSPKVAVLGLNPHAGERGLLGSEELEVIGPVIARRSAAGSAVEGPFGADGYFGALMRAGGEPTHDAIVALYHDQGLLPVKALAFGRAVNVSLGLPIVRTSVDHGCAWDLAGTGRADAGSMEVAVEHAAGLLGTVSA